MDFIVIMRNISILTDILSSTSMRSLILFIILFFVFQHTLSNSIGKGYFTREVELSEIAFKKRDTLQCLMHCKNIIREFELNSKLHVKDFDVCNFAFDAYNSLYLWGHNTFDEKRKYIGGIFYLLKSNTNWAIKNLRKNTIKNLYTSTIFKCIENREFILATKYIDEMVWFADNYYKSNLNDILLTVSLMYRNMDNFEEANKICERLYLSKETLDNVQLYSLISNMIYHSFMEKDYNKVVNLATKNKKLILKSNESSKESLIYLVCNSINNIAESYKLETYSSVADSLYIESYTWSKAFSHPYVPMAIINRAYYNYHFKTRNKISLGLFYSFIDYCEHDSDFDKNKYILIEDIQNAVISILLNDIIRAKAPIDLTELMRKYNKIFSYLIEKKKGEYYLDFIQALHKAQEVNYGNKD